MHTPRQTKFNIFYYKIKLFKAKQYYVNEKQEINKIKQHKTEKNM